MEDSNQSHIYRTSLRIFGNKTVEDDLVAADFHEAVGLFNYLM